MQMNLDNPLIKNMLNNLDEGVYYVDLDRQITFWNKGAELISGYKGFEVTGSGCRDDILVHIDDQGNNLCNKGCLLSETLKEGKSTEARLYLHHKRGHRVPVQVRTLPICDESGVITGVIQIFSDVSDRNAALEQLADSLRELDLDPVSGLAGRQYTKAELKKKHAEMKISGTGFGVVLIEADQIEKIYGTHGIETGDRTARMLAKTLLKSSRSFDIIGQWRKDAVMVLLANVSEQLLGMIAERYRVLIEQSYVKYNASSIAVTVSVGVTEARVGDTYDGLVDRVERLVISSKLAGGNRLTRG